MNTSSQRSDTIAVTGRVLGALFYYAPDSEQGAPLVHEITQPLWYQHWPVADHQLVDIAQQFASTSQHTESLAQAWQRLFIGPWALPAPPWGSVWLDHENVLFGDSMLQLRQWLREQNIDCGIDDTEPCDHIGILLMLAAWLAESAKQQALDQLLAWHLLPWTRRFLEVFISKADHPFYCALGRLTRLTLNHWQQQLIIPLADKSLFL